MVGENLGANNHGSGSNCRYHWISCIFLGSNPSRFIISPKNGGDLCAHRVGGASTIRFACAWHNPYFELPRPVTEATGFRDITKLGEEAPRLAARTENGTTQNTHKSYNTTSARLNIKQ